MSSVQAYLKNKASAALQELTSFLKIPSISTVASAAPDIARAADFVANQMHQIGLQDVQLITTKGNPLVYGTYCVAQQAPTVLVYGHYDVQPPEPYEAWETPPFEPTIREGKIYARGASDDKGQVHMHLKAIEAMLATGTLPCNVKVIIEGEEEIGSPSIRAFVDSAKGKALLASDLVLVSDTQFLSPTQPGIPLGLRGIAALEVTITGPAQDLHSGTYGGAVANPIEQLSRILAQLKDNQGKVQIPGFYDKVMAITDEEQKIVQQQQFDVKRYKKEVGVDALMGEAGYNTLERTGLRPSVEINGIWGGYTGEGVKTVLPSQAHAKISFRLVPNQDPTAILKACKAYLLAKTPKGVTLQLKVTEEGSKALRIPYDAPVLQAAKKALLEVWGSKPAFFYEGGSIPVLSTMQHALAAEIVMLGFGLPSDAIHSPNESFSIDHFHKGIATIVSFYKHYTTKNKF